MSVSRRSIFGPSAASQNTDPNGRPVTGPFGSIDDAGPGAYPAASNDPMGETGVDNTTQARHAGIVQDHKSAANFEQGRAVPGDQSGAGMVIGGQSPLVTSSGTGDAPNQGTPMKTIAGSDGFSTSSDGDSGDNTGAGKVLG